MSDHAMPESRQDLLARMRLCRQMAGLDVLQHGMMVRRAYGVLMRHLDGAPAPEGWRVPDWAHESGLGDRLLPDRVIRQYQVFHDCGKPFVETTIDGQRRFPGHAQASETIWLAVGGDPTAARLMGMDMDAHLLKAEGIAEFAARPEAATLLLTAVAEVHANATLFGGLDSDSFKMKAKHLDKRGRQVMAQVPRPSATMRP